jgi:hypothetical protein
MCLPPGPYACADHRTQRVQVYMLHALELAEVSVLTCVMGQFASGEYVEVKLIIAGPPLRRGILPNLLRKSVATGWALHPDMREPFSNLVIRLQSINTANPVYA